MWKILVQISFFFSPPIYYGFENYTLVRTKSHGVVLFFPPFITTHSLKKDLIPKLMILSK